MLVAPGGPRANLRRWEPMSHSDNSREQSMEEILASIRNTVSSDGVRKVLNSSGAAVAPPPSPQNSPRPPANPVPHRLSEALSRVSSDDAAPLTSNASSTPPATPFGTASPSLDKDLDDLFEEPATATSMPPEAAQFPGREAKDQLNSGHGGGHPATAPEAAPNAQGVSTALPLAPPSTANATPDTSPSSGAHIEPRLTKSLSFGARMAAGAVPHAMTAPQTHLSPSPSQSGIEAGENLGGGEIPQAPTEPASQQQQSAAAQPTTEVESSLDALAANLGKMSAQAQTLSPAPHADDGNEQIEQMASALPDTSDLGAENRAPTAESETGDGQADTADEQPLVSHAVSQADSHAPTGTAAAQSDRPAKPDGRTLEDVVVEILRPQLQTWLEANMPRIVERALRAEALGKKDTD